MAHQDQAVMRSTFDASTNGTPEPSRNEVNIRYIKRNLMHTKTLKN